MEKLWVCGKCGRKYRHQSSYCHHIHGYTAYGRKPCSGKKPVTIHLTTLVPHQHENKFPGFVTQTTVEEILAGSVENIASAVLSVIHLSPDPVSSRPYCNVYWPNVKHQEVVTYDGKGWTITEFDTWISSFWKWVYRCLESF